VRHPATTAAIGNLTRRAWESGGRDYAATRLPPQMMADVEQGVAGGIAEAPVIVVVCGDTSATDPSVLAASIFPAVQNLLLAATALGLASALTTLTTVYGDDLSAVLGLPEHLRAMAVVPIGFPTRAQ